MRRTDADQEMALQEVRRIAEKLADAARELVLSGVSTEAAFTVAHSNAAFSLSAVLGVAVGADDLRRIVALLDGVDRTSTLAAMTPAGRA